MTQSADFTRKCCIIIYAHCIERLKVSARALLGASDVSQKIQTSKSPLFEKLICLIA